jgi:hypothetical protein
LPVELGDELVDAAVDVVADLAHPFERLQADSTRSGRARRNSGTGIGDRFGGPRGGSGTFEDSVQEDVGMAMVRRGSTIEAVVAPR